MAQQLLFLTPVPAKGPPSHLLAKRVPSNFELQPLRCHCAVCLRSSVAWARALPALTIAAASLLPVRRYGRGAIAHRRTMRSNAEERHVSVLFLDPCSPGLTERLQGLGCCSSHRGAEESVADALVRVQPEVAVVRSSQLKEQQLEEASVGCQALRLVMRAGAGVDNIAVPMLAARGVVVANAAGANAIAVAELTLAHLLNLDRQICDQVEALRQGRWERLEFAKGAMGLYGRTLAVLGVGHIGREVIKRARAFGMRVQAFDIALSEEEAQELGAQHCGSAEEAAEGAHALSIHLPLTSSTEGLVGRELLQRLQPGGLVVNMSRGGVVNEAALLAEVEARGLRAGLDVYAQEPGAGDAEFSDAAIMSSSGVYGTHHTGARTEQAASAVEDAVVEAVSALLAGRPVPGQIA
eukprot:TRINITY_DN65696_c0_g1_i1.p1 TRINITY_DN65696_c0_g1~~TRINITY_DN65696_c0_g1_i1.p1  ORF type:complete len:410 (+),score=101.80 TRINITY_DN65696_c0_g1_i1:32-1261(+)